MKIAWMLEETTFDDISTLIEVLKETNTPIVTYKYIPFDGGIQFTSGQRDFGYCPYDKVFVYGSLNSVRYLQRKNYSELITWCNLEKFKCSYYFPRIQHYLLNMDGVFIPYGCFKSAYLKSKIFKDTDNAIFVRPDSGYKNFTGRILTKEYYDDYKLWDRFLMPEDLCLVSSPKNIYKEWRFIVDNTRHIVTGSQYKKNGNISISDDIPSDVISYLNYFLEKTDYHPDPFFTIDVCNINNAKDFYYIVEPNSMSCSGLYACDRLKIVNAINNFLRTEIDE